MCGRTKKQRYYTDEMLSSQSPEQKQPLGLAEVNRSTGRIKCGAHGFNSVTNYKGLISN